MKHNAFIKLVIVLIFCYQPHRNNFGKFGNMYIYRIYTHINMMIPQVCLSKIRKSMPEIIIQVHMN